MLRISSFGALVALATLGSAVDRARLDGIASHWVKTHSVPGVAVAVVENGKLTYANGFGFADEAKTKPIKPETTFLIGSVTKQFTAGAIMLLVRDKKLKLDDPITLHLREAPDKWKGITIKHLLQHTSGLYSYTNMPGLVESAKAYRFHDILKIAQDRPMEFAPGEKFEYNNTGYYFLGEIIARVSKKPYDVFMADRIFKPLGMKDTYVYKTGKPRAGESTGFGPDGKPMPAPASETPGAAGALASNVLDLAKWDAALRTNKLFTVAEKALMWSPTVLNSGSKQPYGFGWVLMGGAKLEGVEHGGGIPGFISQITRFINPDITVIALQNQIGEVGPTSLVTLIAAESAPELKARFEVKPVEDSNPILTQFLEKSIRDALAGTPDTSKWSDSLKGALTPQLIQQVRTQLAPLGGTQKVILIGREGSGARTVHTFVVEFEKGKLKAILATNADGFLTDFLLQPYP